MYLIKPELFALLRLICVEDGTASFNDESSCIEYSSIQKKQQTIDRVFMMMCQKGTNLDHDFYVVVGKQCRTENA